MLTQGKALPRSCRTGLETSPGAPRAHPGLPLHGVQGQLPRTSPLLALWGLSCPRDSAEQGLGLRAGRPRASAPEPGPAPRDPREIPARWRLRLHEPAASAPWKVGPGAPQSRGTGSDEAPAGPTGNRPVRQDAELARGPPRQLLWRPARSSGSSRRTPRGAVALAAMGEPPTPASLSEEPPGSEMQPALGSDSQVLTYRHGIPTSLVNTGQQWDSPNGWAPLQDLVIRGLAQSASPRTQEVAFQLAQNWIRTNFDVYSHKSAMYEKYDVVSGGQPGGGGEYDVQEGFGWTNGVALMLLDRYGDRLSAGAPRARQVPGFLLATLLLGFLPQCP